MDGPRPAHEAPSVRSQHDRIVNEFWPLHDAKGRGHARGIPDQAPSIPVRVRVVWEGGGEQWIDGTARRWTHDAVFVAFAHEWRATAGVWVKPEDIRRR
jgi:hypothetical protein